MTTETRIKRSEVEKMSIAEIVDDNRVKDRFVELYNARTGSTSGIAFYALTIESFIRAIQEDTNLSQCTPMSLYSAFLDMAYYGINVTKSSKPQAYLLWNNVNVGTAIAKNYQKRARLEISPYGELFIRQSMGQIKHADNPVIVHEGDEYSGVYYKDGQKTVDYKPAKVKSTKIVAAFMRIERVDGSVDYAEITLDRMKQLAGYSERKNKQGNADGKANALYSSNAGQPDEGFLVAKLIKHAFSTYPRAPKNPNLQATFTTEKEDAAEDVYGVDEETGEVTNGSVVEECEAEDVTPEIKPDETF